VTYDDSDGEERLIKATPAAVGVRAQNRRGSLSHVLQDEPQEHPDDIAVLTVFFE
jgi:hypothetical protein